MAEAPDPKARDFDVRYGQTKGEHGESEQHFYPGYEDFSKEGRAAIDAYNKAREDQKWKEGKENQNAAVDKARKAFHTITKMPANVLYPDQAASGAETEEQ